MIKSDWAHSPQLGLPHHDRIVIFWLH
jgi:hypothetical protein